MLAMHMWYASKDVTYFFGACVNANSKPVIIMNASLKATKTYAGAWIHT
jgi:hypothetical protein